MRGYAHHAWMTCLASGLTVAISVRMADAADCSVAIDKAIAEWSEKEPAWRYPPRGPLHLEPYPGAFRSFQLDQRTRIAFGRPIAKALAEACGKSDVVKLQERVLDAPELILLTLDELGASSAVAECVVKLVGEERLENVNGKWFPRKGVLVWASMCSPATRRATAVALAKMPLVATEISRNKTIPTGPDAWFIAAVGDEEALQALEAAASDPTRADWRRHYVEAASLFRERQALPPKAREIRENDDLLFWQANTDTLNYHVASMNYEQSAQTLANQHERISTEYLLEKLRGVLEEVAHRRQGKAQGLPHTYRVYTGSAGMILAILGKQRDPAAIPSLARIAQENPEIAPRIKETLQAIGTDEAKRAAAQIAERAH